MVNNKIIIIKKIPDRKDSITLNVDDDYSKESKYFDCGNIDEIKIYNENSPTNTGSYNDITPIVIIIWAVLILELVLICLSLAK
jgi:hypothetical protein